MYRDIIVFVAPGKAELQHQSIPELSNDSVLLRTEYTVISTGTEYANLIGSSNTNGGIRDDQDIARFPRTLGYCGVGTVLQVGDKVTTVQPGDRAVIYFGVHASMNVVPESKVIKIVDDDLDFIDAAPTVIANISLGGIRMAQLEIGESVLVMGLGILGIYAVELAKLNGAYPVIAADPNPDRRELALEHGADLVLDPTASDFSETVKCATENNGVKAVIEVSGVAMALHQALECTARFARVVLLGCTRENDIPTDYYHLVHYPGIQILGAHTFVRPKFDSRKGYWTYEDDCKSVLNLISGKRWNPGRLITHIYKPQEASVVFKSLADDRSEFPLGVAFDWRSDL